MAVDINRIAVDGLNADLTNDFGGGGSTLSSVNLNRSNVIDLASVPKDLPIKYPFKPIVPIKTSPLVDTESSIKTPIVRADVIKTPKNELGLDTLVKPKPIVGTPPPKPLIEKLVENQVDSETLDISSRAIEFIINVVDDVYVNVPDVREISYPKVVRGADFVGYDVDFTIGWSSVDATFLRIYVNDSKEYIQVSTTGTQVFNVKELIERYNIDVTEDTDIVNINFKLVPYNIYGSEEIVGPAEIIPIVFDKGDLTIPRDVAVNRIVEGFISQFTKCEFDESKFLTHLLHLGNGDNKVITTWTGLLDSDGTGNDSLILKLYEPLPASVQLNQKVWISKFQTEPIIETITITSDIVDYCPPLKGPNFSLVPDTGIGYQIFDDLIASGSTSSNSLIQEYVSKKGIDTEVLNIEYTSGSEYIFENFVHFGSAEERVKNFVYKVELLESYQSKYNSVSSNTIELGYITTEDGYVLYTEQIISAESASLQFDSPTTTTTAIVEANKQIDNINTVIGGFDGFEKWLYTSTDSLAYPKSGSVVVSSSSVSASVWYTSIINYASDYDRNNPNYLNNNLPEFIKDDFQNEDFMLFMDMIGQHFDIIWGYVNSLAKLKNPQHKSDKGFSNDLVYSMLDSLGWNGKKAFDSQFLWEYALGLNKDGTQKYQQSLKSANEEVWRRILNNLPYLLKHKGTSRSLKAVMACYGIPQSLLTIMEFGGPQDPTLGGTSKFTYDDRTSALNLTGLGEYISIGFKPVSSNYPNGIELRVKSEVPHSTDLLKLYDPGESDILWNLKLNNTSGEYAKLEFYVSSSTEIQSASTAEFRMFDGEYKQIALNRTVNGTNHVFEVFVKDSIGDRIRINTTSDQLDISGSNWTGSGISNPLWIGDGFTGSLDEFRLWKTPLEDGVIETHTLLPDSINGNNYTASSEDLLVRFDFEYPKDLNANTTIKNVALNTAYASDGLATNFVSSPTYPYHFEVYERTVTANVPSLGFNYSDKIRFESQELVGDLSHKVRATKKAFDRAPIDSSRLGLFFSPIKELNMDILKSFGNFNIDNFIGAPADEYRDEYRELSNLREYYFERLDRDIYEYINLVRYIDKSLFDVLEDLVPARAKVSKGLLIEPHLLERSKTRWTKPVSEKANYDGSINIDETNNIESEYNVKNAIIDANDTITLSYEYNNFDSELNVDDIIVFESTTPFYNSEINVNDITEFETEYPTYDADITVEFETLVEGGVDGVFSSTQIGMEKDSLENAGFGLYAQEGTGSITTIDVFGNMTSSRQLIFQVKEQFIEKVKVQTEGWPATTNNEQVKYEIQNITNYRYKVSTLPIGSLPPVVGNDIVEVIPLNGYFPTHYRYKNNLSEGLQQSFFKGSQQTASTTPDGLDPVESFTTNPNVLRVANTGRGSGEPILEVD
jgi:hypothetical protein